MNTIRNFDYKKCLKNNILSQIGEANFMKKMRILQILSKKWILCEKSENFAIY
jgi:hypothetical protein